MVDMGDFDEAEREALLRRAVGPKSYDAWEAGRRKSWNAQPGTPEFQMGMDADDSVVADELRMQAEGTDTIFRPSNHYEYVAVGQDPKVSMRTTAVSAGVPFCHVKHFSILRNGAWRVVGLGTTLYTAEHAKAAYDSYIERFPELVDD